MSRPAIANIHLDHLCHNYRVLKEKAGNATVMAVVKANAYGHGLDLIASTLLDEGCQSFAVTDAEEGLRLRHILGSKPDITVLSGIFDTEDATLCLESTLTPVVTEIWQINALKNASFPGRVWLKVDTGMKRLGCEDAARLFIACREQGIDIAGIMSHLACADEPDHPLNHQQAKAFQQYLAALPEPVPASLLNSAGLVSIPEYVMDVVRPGIALYGAEPVSSRPLGLQPVMQLTSRIMQVRTVRKGESVSYGAAFTASKDMRIAVAALGYADGLPRSLSNRGMAIPTNTQDKDAILPVVGRVCMDYCLLDASYVSLTTNDTVEFWGEAIPAVDVARQAGTIAYELFTGVGERVMRKAVM
ncbi:MAG: alanine racemase [Zetaproteobacteria bacterium]|nr:MAG: alanine racemase [Zetaproteobacteria bacterium]